MNTPTPVGQRPAPITLPWAVGTPHPLQVPPQGGYTAKRCVRSVSNDYDPYYPEELKAPETPAALERMAAGVAYEDDIEDHLRTHLDPRTVAYLEGDRTPESKRAREQETVELMRNPGDVTVIWNARLPATVTVAGETHRDVRISEPDLLVRAGDSPIDGRWRWHPLDVKHHNPFQGTAKARSWQATPLEQLGDTPLSLTAEGTPRLDDAMQLAHYQRHLEWLGFAHTGAVGGIIGKPIDDQLYVIWHQLDEKWHERRKTSALKVYDREFQLRLEAIAHALTREHDPNWEPLFDCGWTSSCKEDPWREVIYHELKLADSPLLLPGITAARLTPHEERGVRTISAICELDVATATAVDAGVNVRQLMRDAASDPDPARDIAEIVGTDTKKARTSLEKLKAGGITTVGDFFTMDPHTASYAGSGVWRLADTIDQARAFKTGEVYRRRNIEAVELDRQAIELDIDIEDADGIVYLIGVYASGRHTTGRNSKSRAEFHSFVSWDHSDDGEAEIFATFWEYLNDMRAYARMKHYGLRMFHYHRHEVLRFRALAEKHAGKPGIPTVEELEELFASQRWVDMFEPVGQLLWPTESQSLKDIAAHVGFQWRDETPGGDNSIAWYKQAIDDRQDPNARDESRQRILDYNEDDCRATLAIRDWLTRAGEARKPGSSLKSIAELDQMLNPRQVRHPAAA